MSWTTAKLADLATVSSGGGAPQDADAFSTEGIPFVRAGSLIKLLDGLPEDGLELLQPEVAAAHKLKLFPAGTVLFAKSGMSATKGHIYQLKKPAYVVNHLAALTPRSEIAGRYLRRVLEFKSPTCLIKDEAYPSIRLGEIENMEVPAPLDDAGKERIAAILDQADELRRKRQRAIDRLNQLGQAIFHEMFGDPKTNPHSFPTIPLGELIKVSSGSGLIASDQKGGDFPVYGGNGINGWHDDFTVPAGTIVIGRVGVYCGAVHVTDQPAWVTDNALVVSLKQPVNSTYLAAALKVANLNQYAGRSAQPLVSGSRIYPIEILNPPLEKQDHFQSKIREIEALTSRHCGALAAKEKLFSALQHRAFQGEL